METFIRQTSRATGWNDSSEIFADHYDVKVRRAASYFHNRLDDRFRDLSETIGWNEAREWYLSYQEIFHAACQWATDEFWLDSRKYDVGIDTILTVGTYIYNTRVNPVE